HARLGARARRRRRPGRLTGRQIRSRSFSRELGATHPRLTQAGDRIPRRVAFEPVVSCRCMETNMMSRVAQLREPNPELLRTPPYNTEAEQALLGAILINNTAYYRVCEFLQPEHFGNAVHGRIFAAIGKLLGRGQIANPVTLKNLFDQDGALTEIGGAQYLARLAEAAVTIINAEHYGRTIHDLHLRRELITIGQD